MNNLIIIGMTTSSTYVALSSTPIRATGTLILGFPIGIGDPYAYIEGLGGVDVAIPFAVPIHLDRVDLSKIRLKSGVTGDAPASFIGHNAD